MRAARFYGITDLRIEEIPKPIPKENEVLVDVEWCGICGSDLHEYEHGPSSIPKEGKPHVLTKEAIPITMGHEFCGRISQVSPKSKLKVGQPVMVDPRLYCESCNRCEVKGTNVCYSWGFKGLSGGGGGLSETVAVEEKMCYALPETADLSVAALIEPLAVAMHVVKNTGIADFAKMSILILGGGPIGLAMIMILRTKGAKTIYVSEPTLKRQEQNREFADLVFDPTKERVGDRCKELSGGEGVDIVFDCAGNEFAMKDGMEALRWRGKYANVAGWVKPLTIPFGQFMFKELTFTCSMAYNDEDFRETVEAFSAGAFPGIKKLVTSRIRLEDVVEKGFTELISNTADHIKILVSPKAEYSNES